MVTGANYAGDYEPQGAITFQSSKGTSAVITKGNVCNIVSGKWVTAATTATVGPFAVATKTTTAAATTQQLVKRAIVYVKAEGNITVNGLVQVSATTAGAVMAYAASTIYSTTVTGTQVINGAADFSRVVGIYLGHENEGDGATIPTDAVDTDTVRILMTGAL